MVDIKLTRLTHRNKSTLGILSIADFECFTLELPWIDNQQNVSCIPAGDYLYKKRFSPSRKATVIELIDVPGRTHIQIHTGNYTRQIKGCILPGLGLKDIDKDGVFDVTNSGSAFKKIMALSPETGNIEVI
jgi:hypothetical protein